jgi:hypothetical protein
MVRKINEIVRSISKGRNLKTGQLRCPTPSQI